MGLIVRALAIALVSRLSFGVQSPVAQTGLIAGHVIDAGTGRPVAGAMVTLTFVAPRVADNSPQHAMRQSFRRVMTEPGGGFVFADVPAGRHMLSASKGGFAEGGYGRMRPGGEAVPVEIAEGAHLRELTVRMWKYGALAGTIVDEAGEPMVGVTVQALSKQYSAGRVRLMRSASASTDDRGAYRIGGLLPGHYLVVVPSTTITLPGLVVDEYARDPATLRAVSGTATVALTTGISENQRIGDLVVQGSLRVAADARAVYRTSFYPAAGNSEDATVITLGSAEARTGLDISMRPQPAVRVSGTLKGPDAPVSLQAVRLVPQSVADTSTSDNAFEAAVAVTDHRGAFTFLGVPAGQYVLRAAKSPRPFGRGGAARGSDSSPEPALWTSHSIVVGTQDVILDVTMNLALSVSGSCVFEGNRPPTSGDPITVTIEAADGREQFKAQLQSANVFVASGIPAGRYFVHATLGPSAGWTMKSATLNGRDVADTAFDVKSDISGIVLTFTDALARVSGTVRTSQGGTFGDASVIIFPADPAGWIDYGLNPRRIRHVPVDSAGGYGVSGLPPGDYMIVAVSEDAETEWRWPGLFEVLSRSATRLHLTERGQSIQDLRLVVIR